MTDNCDCERLVLSEVEGSEAISLIANAVGLPRPLRQAQGPRND